jgi:uncharacterized protein (DUF305 family)
MTSLIGRIAAVVAAVAAALFLSSCTSPASDGNTDHQRTDEPVITGEPAGFNADDVAFATNMIPHHQQAVEMAALAETRASDTEVKDLTAKIKAAQDPEIETMQGWLTVWGKPAPSGGMGHDMAGIMSEDDMNKLEAARGAEFDRQFAQMMTAHHNGAIEMARTEQAQGADPEAKALAKTIEIAQQAEVAQMQKILDRL